MAWLGRVPGWLRIILIAAALSLGFWIAVGSLRDWRVALGVFFVGTLMFLLTWRLARGLADECSDLRLRRLVWLSYTTTLLALLASVAVIPIASSFGKLSEFLATSPIGLLVGCSSRTSDGEPNRCGLDGLEWVVNIGGRVSEPLCESTVSCDELDEFKKALDSATDSNLRPLVDAGHKLVRELRLASAERLAFEAALTQADPVPEDATKAAEVRDALRETGRKLYDHLALDQRVARITGGLRVPLYFEILALMGGAISMMRRVPEIQRRSGASYRGEYERAQAAKPPGTTLEMPSWLSADAAREHLIFQILQLVSAPFLALAAWALVEPDRLASAVGLGFVSGFASEPVLLMIRALADKVRPDATRPPPPAPGPAAAGEAVGAAPPLNAQRALEQMEDALKTAADAVKPGADG